jgi:hypothetical protein
VQFHNRSRRRDKHVHLPDIPLVRNDTLHGIVSKSLVGEGFCPSVMILGEVKPLQTCVWDVHQPIVRKQNWFVECERHSAIRPEALLSEVALLLS